MPKNVQAKNWPLSVQTDSRRYSDPIRPAGVSAVWANDGGEKLPAEDIRATTPATAIAAVVPAAPTTNLVNVGDGTYRIFGARNETLGFCLQLESTAGATGLSVAVSSLTGPGGAAITTTSRSNADYGSASSVCNYTGRNIEVFLLDYVPIEMLSRLSYERYDERHVPHKLRAPSGSGPWASRPGAGKFFPEWCVPHEWRSTFSIAAGKSQGVWVDVYIPKGTAPGTYTGTISIRKDGAEVRAIPLQLKVRNFTLPDVPVGKTVCYLNEGYTGEAFGAGNQANMMKAMKQMLHRHGVTPVSNENTPGISPPTAAEQAQLNGVLYSSAEGYDGYGKDTPDRFYWVGIYGAAIWRDADQATYSTRLNEWATWFSANAPTCEFQYYLTDEPRAYKINSIVKGATTTLVVGGTGHGGIGTAGQSIRVGGATGVTSINGTFTISSKTETGGNTEVVIPVDTSAAGTYGAGSAECSTDWVSIVSKVDKVLGAGSPGNTVKTFITANMREVSKLDPRIDVVAAWFSQEQNPQYGALVAAHNATPGHQYWQYNGKRIASGSWATEDDGVALRATMWAQFKLLGNQARWYYWSANYWRDYQTGRPTVNQPIDLWTDAITFGNPGFPPTGDTNYGPRYGFNTTNGDGVLLAPGRDVRFSSSGPGVLGPVASLRLKLWRRAIHDVDYLAQASAINAGSVTSIVSTRVPAVLWEVDVDDDNDPTYRNAPISWSINPDDWEASRKALADIVDPAGA